MGAEGDVVPIPKLPAPVSATGFVVALALNATRLLEASTYQPHCWPVDVFVIASIGLLLPDMTMTLSETPLIKFGDPVPMPTLPLAAMSMLLEGALGRMRSGKVLPWVTSRTKKFASLPATSQICCGQPELPS